MCGVGKSEIFYSFFMRAMHKKFTHFFFISSSSFGCSFLFACVFREAQIKAKNSTVENFIFYSFCGDFFQHGFLIPQRHIESKCAKRMCFFFLGSISLNFIQFSTNMNQIRAKGEKKCFACITGKE